MSENNEKPKLVYVADLTHTYQTIALNTVPFPVAGLVSYAKAKLKDPKCFKFRIFKYPEKLINALLETPPDILCFSNYVWNLDLGYSIAERVKKDHPKVIVIFGGPNYPTDFSEQEKFLLDHPVIDFYAYKEGEISFTELLDSMVSQNFEVSAVKALKPRSFHYLAAGVLETGFLVERIKDLEDIPSPYLTGELDEFFDATLIPMIQTNRGCPFTCTFCVEGLGYYNKVNKRSVDTVRKELEYIAGHKHPNVHDLHIVDSNFGMYKEDEGIADAIAGVQESHGWPEYIHVATGKNQKERVLRVAKTINGALRLAGSVQSLSEKVLENIKRGNISADQLMDLAHKARELGSNTYSEIIVALPGETKESHFETIGTIVNAKFNWVRIYTLMMLSGVEMSNIETRKKYEMQTRYRVVPRCFGSYNFGDAPLLSAEVEEVCVATKDMSFDDYLECRLFHLTVEIFYNDSVSSELVEFLNLFGISVFDWLKHIHEQRDSFPEPLKKIYQNFSRLSREELWDSKEELLKFAKDEQVIRKYLTGEYGSNLIFTHKAMAMAEALKEVLGVAYAGARSILNGSQPETLGKYSDYLSNLQVYSELKKVNLFDDKSLSGTGNNPEFSRPLFFDFLELENQGFHVLPDNFRRPDGVQASFVHTEEQRKIIRDSLDLYGRNIIGIARVLSKVHVTKLYRTLLQTDIID